jgi:putative transport protein
MNGGVLLGTRGARTSAGALAAIRNVANRSVSALGYGIAYAIGNVLLDLSGTILAAVLT